MDVIEADERPHPARRAGLAEHAIGGDLLVYDGEARQLHVLNATAALIWDRCDGDRSAGGVTAAIAEDLGLEPSDIAADVARSLDDFATLGLLAGTTPPEPESPLPEPPTASADGLPDPSTLDLPHATPLLRVGGTALRYRTDAEPLAEHLRSLLAALVVDDQPGSVTEVRVRAPAEEGATWAIWVDDEVVARPADERGVAAFLLWDLNRLAITLGPPRLSLHCGAVVDVSGPSPRVVVLPAPPDSGKSTLTLGLVRSGLAYLGDEAFGVVLDDQRIVPHLKPLTLDPGSWPLFEELEPSDEVSLRFRHGKWHLDLREVGGGLAPEPWSLHASDVALVVLPRYVEGAATTVEPLTPAELAVALAENAFNLAATGAAGLAALGGLASSARGWRLESGDLGEAVAAVRELLAGAG